MRIYTYILTVFSILASTSCAVQKTIAPSAQISENADLKVAIDQVEIDNLQNIYILTTEDHIIRYDQDLNKLYEYNNSQTGDITAIDATNPQKILCFIKDFNRILVLDNTLAEINTIDLSTTNYLDIDAVARSNDNRIWLFDPINQVLIKIDEFARPVFESNRLSDYNMGQIIPTIIRERNNRVVMVDPNIGVLIFDNYGQFLKLIPELDVDHIQIFGDYLFFAQEGRFFQYHIRRYEKSALDLDGQGFEKFKLTSESTYLFGKSGLVKQ